ncbi:hypothetical protein DFH09DRAFT_1099509 [Mycena vulgaris]|nr:hypothetical protein DFH09DRAFT_1099509 [Mycena vulgaris]
MDGLWLGLEAVALARLRVFFGQLWQENIAYASRNDENGSKATAFWPGFGLSECKAGPKAISGQHFGLALALVPKPKSRGFLASGQSQSITNIATLERRIKTKSRAVKSWEQKKRKESGVKTNRPWCHSRLCGLQMGGNRLKGSKNGLGRAGTKAVGRQIRCRESGKSDNIIASNKYRDRSEYGVNGWRTDAEPSGKRRESASMRKRGTWRVRTDGRKGCGELEWRYGMEVVGRRSGGEQRTEGQAGKERRRTRSAQNVGDVSEGGEGPARAGSGEAEVNRPGSARTDGGGWRTAAGTEGKECERHLRLGSGWGGSRGMEGQIAGKQRMHGREWCGGNAASARHSRLVNASGIAKRREGGLRKAPAGNGSSQRRKGEWQGRKGGREGCGGLEIIVARDVEGHGMTGKENTDRTGGVWAGSMRRMGGRKEEPQSLRRVATCMTRYLHDSQPRVLPQLAEAPVVEQDPPHVVDHDRCECECESASMLFVQTFEASSIAPRQSAMRSSSRMDLFSNALPEDAEGHNVRSRVNPADDPSRGKFAARNLLLPPLPIPAALAPFICDFDAPFAGPSVTPHPKQYNSHSHEYQQNDDNWIAEFMGTD